MSVKKYDFDGKVALVTGSSSGIGAAIAIQLAGYGARLTITGRDVKTLNDVAEKIEQISGQKPLQLIGDLGEETFAVKLITETVAKYSRLDVLVNNAGCGTPNGRLNSENLLEEFDNVYALNVRAPLQLTQLAVPHLAKTKGNIINISSIGSMKPFQTVYCSSKAALDMITKTTAQELGAQSVRVNSINPGPVRTNFGRSTGRATDAYKDPNTVNFLKNFTALGRMGEPEDIANLASFLASSDAVNITGSILVNDTGLLIGPSPQAARPSGPKN